MLDIKTVVKHLANGSLGENLCLICLNPLKETCENIFTKICKEDGEFCVADALGIFDLEFSEGDNYNICMECFVNASSAFRFYVQVKRTKEILEFYTKQLLNSTEDINVPEDSSKAICISLPTVDFPDFHFCLQGLGRKDNLMKDTVNNLVKNKEEDEKIVVIIKDGISSYYKYGEDGKLQPISGAVRDDYKKMSNAPRRVQLEKPVRRKRARMAYISCSYCPVKYRFIKKMKHHMKVDHDIDLYICKICKSITEDHREFQDHMKTHTNVHQCAICSMVFRRRSKIISHLQAHEKGTDNIGSHVCELCGVILKGEEELLEHKGSKHEKKYTCYYCGKMYRFEMGLEAHIRKHEAYSLKGEEESSQPFAKPGCPPREKAQRLVCSTCGNDFVDQRALLWHQRLHTNERPHICKICGKGFVSLNRRNQHMVCAHSEPTKGCPLCPALFHLRSMVNTHIKKVHLKAHKRRNKATKYRNVFWRHEAVPIQELSVDVQNEIIHMQEQNKLNNYGNGRHSPFDGLR